MKDLGLRVSTQGPLWPCLLLHRATCRVPRTPQESAERASHWRWAQPVPVATQGPSRLEGLLHCILGLKGASPRRGASLHPSLSPLPHLHVPRESSACPAWGPLPVPPGSHGEPPSHSLPITPPPGTPPLRPGRSLVARCPLTLPFPHIGAAGTPISGCAVQTPLPKHPSDPARHTRSPQLSSSLLPDRKSVV